MASETECKTQICLICYYPNDNLPNKVNFQRMLKSLSVFKGTRGKACVWERNRPTSDIRPWKIKLDDMSWIDERFREIKHLEGGVDVYTDVKGVDSMLTTDLSCGLHGVSRWMGVDTLADSVFMLSSDFYHSIGIEGYLNIAREHFAIADETGANYGFIDYSLAATCFAGMAYQSIGISELPLWRKVEQGQWVYSGSRRDMARSIYWGNYFGKRILEKLGGRDVFLNDFKRRVATPDGSLGSIVWEFSNGVFVSLSETPDGCEQGRPLSGEWILHWLHKRMIECNVL